VAAGLDHVAVVGQQATGRVVAAGLGHVAVAGQRATERVVVAGLGHEVVAGRLVTVGWKARVGIAITNSVGIRRFRKPDASIAWTHRRETGVE
jgi:hypothetical protein